MGWSHHSIPGYLTSSNNDAILINNLFHTTVAVTSFGGLTQYFPIQVTLYIVLSLPVQGVKSSGAMVTNLIELAGLELTFLV